jgi:Tol biopolymer transport system component
MTLDERGARAVAELRGAVAEPDVARFRAHHGRRERGRRRAAAVAVAAATVLVAATATSIARHVGAGDPSPAAPSSQGRILYGQWDAAQQQSRWFTTRPDGTQLRSVGITATCALWWPDGSKILITDDAQVQQRHPLRPATTDPTGGRLHRLDAAAAPDVNLGCGDVSPDGSQLVLEGFSQEGRSGVNGLYRVRASDGGGLQRLTHAPVGGSDANPRFAPDGQRLLFLRTKPGVSPEGAGALFVATASGSDARQITPWGYAFLGYDWSPDARWIVFQRPYGQLYLVHPDGSGLRRLPLALRSGEGAQNPVWSPDGRRIAFSLSREGHANIYTVGLDGRDLRQVTRGVNVDEQTPDWSP